MGQYLPILVMLILGGIFAAGSFIGSGVFATRRPNRAKLAPYECGIVPRLQAAERFPVRFYLVAMIFIIFDIEIIFLYPFAVAAGELGIFGVLEIATFSVVVFVAFAYLISNGALSWGPLGRTRPSVVLADRRELVASESVREH
ncbi:MAG: NADH-quinone oxidoreductase subunit A [Ferrimicrobium sp.]